MNKYMIQLAALDWAKAFVIGIGIAAGYYFLMYDNGASLQASIQAAQDRVVAAKKTLSETEKALADADRFEKEVQNTQAQFDNIVRYMPVTLNAAEMTKMINEISQEIGVRPRIEPKPDDPPSGFTQAVKVDLQLEGTYAQILTFLSKISQMQRLLVFDKIEIAPNQAAGVSTSQGASLTFKGTLIGYRYLKDAPEPPDLPGSPPSNGGT